MARPISGTIAEMYLRARGITGVCHLRALRFHPNCFYGGHNGTTRNGGPVLIAAVTDLQGRIAGVQRTWLDVSGRGKAPISAPRKALGHLLGNGVRFGKAGEVLLAGEGIETILSLKMVLGAMPMVAALSASHLAALVLPPSLKRLYIACDADPAGRHASERLAQRAEDTGVTVLALRPRGGDFNDDLRSLGSAALSAALRAQMAPDDLPCVSARPMPAGESESA
jgi:hypothetical protein